MNEFPNVTTAYLRDLAQNNNKNWFDANRRRYEAEWLEPAKMFVDAIGPQTAQLIFAAQE